MPFARLAGRQTLLIYPARWNEMLAEKPTAGLFPCNHQPHAIRARLSCKLNTLLSSSLHARDLPAVSCIILNPPLSRPADANDTTATLLGTGSWSINLRDPRRLNGSSPTRHIPAPGTLNVNT